MDILIFLVNHIFLIFCCILTIEIFIRVRFITLLNSVLTISKKVLRVISSSKISDHWKEKMVPYYSFSIFKISFSMFLVLTSIVITFFLPSMISISFIDFILSYTGIIESLCFSFIYIKIRSIYFE